MNQALEREKAAAATADFDAAGYDVWFESPVGHLCWNLEKAAVFGMAKLSPGELVLDIGCGTGIFALEAARLGARVTGVDHSYEMLAIAEAKARHERLPVSFHQVNAEDLPFTSRSFDVVMIVTVLSFAEHPELLLREACRILKPAGRIIIGELNRRSAWMILRKLGAVFRESSYRHANLFSRCDLNRLLEDNGLFVEQGRSILFVPPFNFPPLLKHYAKLEKAGSFIIPGGGAFMVAKTRKHQLPGNSNSSSQSRTQ